MSFTNITRLFFDDDCQKIGKRTNDLPSEMKLTEDCKMASGHVTKISKLLFSPY